MGNMRFKVGDRVRIKSLDWYNANKDEDGNVVCLYSYFDKDMSEFCNKIVTIKSLHGCHNVKAFRIIEDDGYSWWSDDMIEGLVEEEVDLIPKFGEYSDNEPLDVPTMTTEFVKEHGLPCPEGYVFKDENGNVINASKIVLEKKKKEYPKTYEECLKVLGYEDIATHCIFHNEADEKLFNTLYDLKVCRDAYWKIAGEEMGLGRPWEPDWCDYENIKYIVGGYDGEIGKDQNHHIHKILAFPTEEMRDAFYENFKELIEVCKELL